MTALARSNTQDNLNADQVGNLPFPTLDLDGQTAIADYLDRKTARIDASISAQLRLMGLLNERIDGMIKGHIGESDLAHCRGRQSVPLRRVLRKVWRPFQTGAPVITAFRDGEVNARENRRAEGYTLAATDETYQGVSKGDVVIHGLDGFAGAIGRSRAAGCCSPVYHVAEPMPGNDARYVARLLRVLAIDGYVGLHATSVRERAVDLRNWALVGAVPVPLVSSHEQREVGNMIDALAPLAERTRRLDDLLCERRRALITAAVTGQLEVRVAA